jgi:phenylacetic acid degradation protein
VLHGCIVRRDALVGMNAVVMDEAEVGAESFVAACAFVPAGMKIPPRTLVTGMPAKIKRQLSDAEIAWKHEGTLSYQELSKRSLATMREVTPLQSVEPNRPVVQASAVKTLIATKRD